MRVLRHTERDFYGFLERERERERENMEGGASGNGTSCMMGFEDNNMMMPLMNSGHEANSNFKPFLPLPMNTNSYGQKTSGLMPPQDIVDRMETNNSSCMTMRAKIMAHPLFLRLLAAYVNCQKVMNSNFYLVKFKPLSPFLIRSPVHGKVLVFIFICFFALFLFLSKGL